MFFGMKEYKPNKALHSTAIVILSALLIWLVVGLGVGVVGMILAGGYVRSPFENVSWVLRVTLIPVLMAAGTLSFIPPRFVTLTVSRHLTASVTGYFTVVLTGSVFTVIDGIIRFGGVNAGGYFTWSWIYALIFLPISYPLCLLLLKIRRTIQDTEPSGSSN